jgi:hypothetical protein
MEGETTNNQCWVIIMWILLYTSVACAIDPSVKLVTQLKFPSKTIFVV